MRDTEFGAESNHGQEIHQGSRLVSGSYKIEDRAVIAKLENLRASILTVGPGQYVPWHHHSEVTDTIFCMKGPIRVETRSPEEEQILKPGDMATIPPGQPHRVSGVNANRCKFLIIQGVGVYDYVPEADD